MNTMMLSSTGRFGARRAVCCRSEAQDGVEKRAKRRVARRPFDEGAAQVANLLERDEDELTGKSGIGERAFSEFGQTAGKDNLLTIEDFPDAFKPAGGGDSPQKPRPVQLNGSSKPAARAASPFGSAGPAGVSSPFGDMDMAGMNDNSEPGKLSPSMAPDPVSEAPWWSKITKTQIVLVITFTLMTLSMLATCIVVFKTGAIHFNSDAY